MTELELRLQPDLQRFQHDWEQLSAFCDPDQAGFTRRPFTPHYAAARAWLTERMHQAGLEPAVDAAGNLVGRRPGREDLPAIVVGSHSDTVTGGGRFDGMVGVLGGLEVARLLAEHDVELDHPLQIVDMLAEEPTDFGISMVGSRGLSGSLDEDMLARSDGSGHTLADAVGSVGGDPDHILSARRRTGEIGLYLELHIEQGTVLEREDLPVGVVTAITGVNRFRIDIHGRPDHTGGTSMADRRDALTAAAEVIALVERHWNDGVGVGTIGRIDVEPNAINVIPGRVTLWLDMRSVDDDRLRQARTEVPAEIAGIASRRDLRIDVDELSWESPVPIDPAIVDDIASAIGATGYRAHRLPSLAGHDANQLAKVGPIGMIFVRCRDGRSHVPEEWADAADIGLGIEALTSVIRRFDCRPGIV